MQLKINRFLNIQEVIFYSKIIGSRFSIFYPHIIYDLKRLFFWHHQNKRNGGAEHIWNQRVLLYINLIKSPQEYIWSEEQTIEFILITPADLVKNSFSLSMYGRISRISYKYRSKGSIPRRTDHQNGKTTPSNHLFNIYVLQGVDWTNNFVININEMSLLYKIIPFLVDTTSVMYLLCVDECCNNLLREKPFQYTLSFVFKSFLIVSTHGDLLYNSHRGFYPEDFISRALVSSIIGV